MKPDRNSPCPCGSGKKYKKCCIEKDINLERKRLPSIEDVNELEKYYYQHNKMLDQELAERTPAEKAYDDVLLTAYNDGKTIEESIKIANDQYPSEALQYDSSNLGDIENHYDYLLTHLEMKNKFEKAKNKLNENKNYF